MTDTPHRLIGRTLQLSLAIDPRVTGDAWCDVTVIDARAVYGREELEVEPVAGTGRLWVRPARLRAVKTACGPRE